MPLSYFPRGMANFVIRRKFGGRGRRTLDRDDGIKLELVLFGRPLRETCFPSSHAPSNDYLPSLLIDVRREGGILNMGRLFFAGLGEFLDEPRVVLPSLLA